MSPIHYYKFILKRSVIDKTKHILTAHPTYLKANKQIKCLLFKSQNKPYSYCSNLSGYRKTNYMLAVQIYTQNKTKHILTAQISVAIEKQIICLLFKSLGLSTLLSLVSRLLSLVSRLLSIVYSLSSLVSRLLCPVWRISAGRRGVSLTSWRGGGWPLGGERWVKPTGGVDDDRWAERSEFDRQEGWRMTAGWKRVILTDRSGGGWPLEDDRGMKKGGLTARRSGGWPLGGEGLFDR